MVSAAITPAPNPSPIRRVISRRRLLRPLRTQDHREPVSPYPAAARTTAPSTISAAAIHGHVGTQDRDGGSAENLESHVPGPAARMSAARSTSTPTTRALPGGRHRSPTPNELELSAERLRSHFGSSPDQGSRPYPGRRSTYETRPGLPSTCAGMPLRPGAGSSSGTAWPAARDAAQSTADCQDAARHASFEVSLRSSAMVVRLDPVGVLGARPAVLAHERAVDRRVCEHPGGGDSAFGGEIRSHALPSRLRSDSVVRRGGYRVDISSLPSSGSSTSDTTTGSRLVFGAQPVLARRCRL